MINAKKTSDLGDALNIIKQFDTLQATENYWYLQ